LSLCAGGFNEVDAPIDASTLVGSTCAKNERF
jgi:hypothetical protein